MKSFKVKVQNDKAQFFKDLLSNLDFVDFEEVEGFNEPRVYPGANFEIRPNKGVRFEPPEKGKGVPTKEDGLESIRKVMGQIEQQRNKNKK